MGLNMIFLKKFVLNFSDQLLLLITLAFRGGKMGRIGQYSLRVKVSHFVRVGLDLPEALFVLEFELSN